MERLRVLVLPVFRNYWLWEALPSQRGVAAAPKALANWRTGQNLEEKAHLIGLHVSRWLQSKLNMEWQKLVQAPDGSWRNRGFRMAQAVLSREDPRESFFKALPTQPGPVEFTYPGVFRERLIRRRLRHITADGLKSHRRRLLGWSLAMLPQIPLLATPLPNITVYYTGYRIYSHWRALQVCGVSSNNKRTTNNKQSGRCNPGVGIAAVPAAACLAVAARAPCDVFRAAVRRFAF